MANAILSFPNRGDDAVLSGGSFAIPVNQLQTRIIKSPARTTDAIDGSFLVNGVFSKERVLRLVALVRHNFSVESTYRFRLYLDVSLSALEYDSGVLPVFPELFTEESEDWDSGNFFDLTITEEEREDLTATLVHVLPEPYSGQSFTLEVFDSANQDGFLEAGRLFMGSGWQPVHNMSYGAQIGFEPRSLIDEAIGGTEFFDERQDYRVARFALPITSEDEAMGQSFELMRKQSITKDVFFMWDTQDTFHILRRSFLGRLRQLSPIEADQFNIFSNQYEIKELI